MSKSCPHCKRPLRVIRGELVCANGICVFRKMYKKPYVYDPNAPAKKSVKKNIKKS